MVSVKWGNRTLQLVCWHFRLVCGHYFSRYLRLGIWMRLWRVFLRSLRLILWPFPRNFAIFTKFAWLSCLFQCGRCDTGVFMVVWQTWDWVLCISWTEREIGSKTRWKQRNPAKPKPSYTSPAVTSPQQGLWARAKPSETPSSAAEQPIPAVT